MKKYRPNANNYTPSEHFYSLVFMPDKLGYWRELGHDVPKFNDILLSDYLAYMNLTIPDYCQFMRIVTDLYTLTYKAYDALRVQIIYQEYGY